jgi:SNF2 family DNA or RNA helicase
MIRNSVGDKRLYGHQVTAIQWMKSMSSGGLLCDEMGLGKTLTTVGFLLNSIAPYTLILGPIAVLDQWLTVLKTTPFAIYVVKNGVWNHVQGLPIRGRVYLTNYDKLVGNEYLFNYNWNRIICDEAHIIRNYNSKKYLGLKALTYKSIWLLTGTPVVNKIQDLGALIQLIDNKVCAKSATIDKGLAWMSTYALQRTLHQIRDVVTDLPSLAIVHNHVLDFTTEKEAVFYRGIQGHLTKALENMMAQDRMDMTAFLCLILRLRQISTHPQVYINSRKKQLGRDYIRGDWSEDSTKTDKILEILKKDKGDYVIFCHFNDEMEIIKERLEKNGFDGKVLMYNGSMSPEERTSVIEQSKTKGSLLLAQIQTAGTGLNLQHMNRVIFTSSWWTAALMDQAVGRVVRLGQDSEVHVHYLTFKEDESLNIDDFINTRVEMKRDLSTELLAAACHDV